MEDNIIDDTMSDTHYDDSDDRDVCFDDIMDYIKNSSNEDLTEDVQVKKENPQKKSSSNPATIPQPLIDHLATNAYYITHLASNITGMYVKELEGMEKSVEKHESEFKENYNNLIKYYAETDIEKLSFLGTPWFPLSLLGFAVVAETLDGKNKSK